MSGPVSRSLAIGLCAALLPLGALAAPAAEHVFEPGDEIEVSILTTPDSLTGFNQRVVLSEEGMITLPHVGRVAVAGRTASQILPDLDRHYHKLFAYVFVGLQLLKVKPLEPPPTDAVYIAGQVRNPGAIVPLQAYKRLTLADLVGRSGGTTDTADREHVTIYRRLGTVEVVNLDQALQDGSATRIELAPGETVRVPGSWLAAMNTYAPVLQAVMTVVGATVFIGGWVLQSQQAANSAK